MVAGGGGGAPAARATPAPGRRQRLRVTVRRRRAAGGAAPADGVRDHPLEGRMVIRRIRLVPRSETKLPSRAAMVDAAAAEHLAALEPTDELFNDIRVGKLTLEWGNKLDKTFYRMKGHEGNVSGPFCILEAIWIASVSEISTFD